MEAIVSHIQSLYLLSFPALINLRIAKLNNLSFGGYNKCFKPSRTEFDWLSRDEKEVDKYIADPFCGGIFSAGYFYDLLKGLKENHKIENMNKIIKKLKRHNDYCAKKKTTLVH